MVLNGRIIYTFKQVIVITRRLKPVGHVNI